MSINITTTTASTKTCTIKLTEQQAMFILRRWAEQEYSLGKGRGDHEIDVEFDRPIDEVTITSVTTQYRDDSDTEVEG